MEWKLVNGDYVPYGTGGLTALTEGEEVLARVLYRLTARRGALPFLPRLGSRLYARAEWRGDVFVITERFGKEVFLISAHA